MWAKKRAGGKDHKINKCARHSSAQDHYQFLARGSIPRRKIRYLSLISAGDHNTGLVAHFSNANEMDQT